MRKVNKNLNSKSDSENPNKRRRSNYLDKKLEFLPRIEGRDRKWEMFVRWVIKFCICMFIDF